MAEMVLLTTVSSEFEMEIIKQKLDELGIESFSQSGDMGGIMTAMDYASGVKLYVNENDFEKSNWLITNTLDDLDDDMEVGVGD